jgi:hypothetical protein
MLALHISYTIFLGFGDNKIAICALNMGKGRYRIPALPLSLHKHYGYLVRAFVSVFGGLRILRRQECMELARSETHNPTNIYHGRSGLIPPFASPRADVSNRTTSEVLLACHRTYLWILIGAIWSVLVVL